MSSPHPERGPRGMARWWPFRTPTLAPASVLVTGAAGQLGTMLRPALRARFGSVRLTDRASLSARDDGEQVVITDLTDKRGMDRALSGVETVLHLGAESKDAPLEVVSAPNILGMTTLLEAAVRHRVRRVVFASSMHVLGLYRRDEPVTSASAPRPDSCYGISKACGEALARLCHERHGLSVVILRMGHVSEREADAEPGNWLAATDFVRLVELALTAEHVGFEVWHGLSSTDGALDTHDRLARHYGFTFTRPAQCSPTADALARWYPDDLMARVYRGGSFASGAVLRSRFPEAIARTG